MERNNYFGHYFFMLHMMALVIMVFFVRFPIIALGLVLASIVCATISGSFFTEAQYAERRSSHE